jgi:hypothetical protein
MVVVMRSEECEATGLQGEHYSNNPCLLFHLTYTGHSIGTRIGRLRLIFKLPTQVYWTFDALAYWPTEPLAYVEWYSLLKPTAQKDHLMYLISKVPRRKRDLAPADFVPLSSIHQSCQLIPCFGEEGVLEEWRSEKVLEQCDRF